MKAVIRTTYSYYMMLCPPLDQATQIDAARVRHGYDLDIVERHRLHMTLNKLAIQHPSAMPDIVNQIDHALDGHVFRPCEIILDRLVGGELRSSERLSGVHKLQADLGSALFRHGLGLPSKHFRPHVSLSYAAYRGICIIPKIMWRATEVVLVESLHGRHVHNVLRRWKLAGNENMSRPEQLEMFSAE